MINLQSAGIVSESNPEKLFKAGVTLLRNDRPKDAMLAFEHALKISPQQPKYMSYLGLSMAKSRIRPKDALDLCRAALNQSVYYPDLFHNLGQVYLMSGNRRRARDVFLKGLKLDRRNAALKSDLIALGVRSKPPLSFLPRGHRLNQILGRTLKRFKLR